MRHVLTAAVLVASSTAYGQIATSTTIGNTTTHRFNGRTVYEYDNGSGFRTFSGAVSGHAIDLGGGMTRYSLRPRQDFSYDPGDRFTTPSSGFHHSTSGFYSPPEPVVRMPGWGYGVHPDVIVRPPKRAPRPISYGRWMRHRRNN